MPEIDPAISRLYEHEGLTGDVDDPAARLLLQWGEAQLVAGRPEELVFRGVRTINKIIAKRADLNPAAAQSRLEKAALAADAAALDSLWAARPSEEEWARRLLQAIAPGPAPPTAGAREPADAAGPRSPAPEAREPEAAAGTRSPAAAAPPTAAAREPEAAAGTPPTAEDQEATGQGGPRPWWHRILRR